jgi:hypothetical protein
VAKTVEQELWAAINVMGRRPYPIYDEDDADEWSDWE